MSLILVVLVEVVVLHFCYILNFDRKWGGRQRLDDEWRCSLVYHGGGWWNIEIMLVFQGKGDCPVSNSRNIIHHSFTIQNLVAMFFKGPHEKNVNPRKWKIHTYIKYKIVCVTSAIAEFHNCATTWQLLQYSVFKCSHTPTTNIVVSTRMYHMIVVTLRTHTHVRVHSIRQRLSGIVWNDQADRLRQTREGVPNCWSQRDKLDNECAVAYKWRKKPSYDMFPTYRTMAL